MFFQGDVLKNKNTLNPEVPRRHGRFARPIAVAAVQIDRESPLCGGDARDREFVARRGSWERMVVMVQWEIADKLIAPPGTKEYGALAILMQSLADVEILRTPAPRCILAKAGRRFWNHPHLA